MKCGHEIFNQGDINESIDELMNEVKRHRIVHISWNKTKPSAYITRGGPYQMQMGFEDNGERHLTIDITYFVDKTQDVYHD